MKNIITSSMSLFKKVRNCYTCQGLNETSATVADISLTSIKYIGDNNSRAAQDRRRRRYEEEINRLRSRGQRL